MTQEELDAIRLIVREEIAAAKTKRLGERKKPEYKVSFDGMAFRGLTDAMMEGWQAAYPGIAVPTIVRQAGEWLKANPERQKKNYQKFLTSWLAREQRIADGKR